MSVKRFYPLILGCLVIYSPMTTNGQKNRRVNVLFINDMNNDIANKSFYYGLRSMANKNILHRFNNLTIDKNDPAKTEEMLCTWWNQVYNNSEQRPDFILDTTINGRSSEVINSFTRQHGIPTLSAQFGQEGDLYGWEGLNYDQQNYLVQVMSPTDLLPEVIYQICTESDTVHSVILYDETFVLRHKHKRLLLNLRNRHFIVPFKSTKQEIMQQIVDFRQNNIVNFILLGSSESTNHALLAGQIYNYTNKFFSWYVVTLEDDFELPRKCKNLSVMIFKPIKPSKSNLDDEMKKSLPKPFIVSAYYYDLFKMGSLAMKSAIETGMWSSEATFTRCEKKSVSKIPPLRSFHFISKLKEVSMNPNFPSYSKFVWGMRNGQHRVHFDTLGEIINGSQGDRTVVASWTSGFNASINVVNLTKINEHLAVPSLRIVTLIQAPFIMWNKTTNAWEGYCIDLLNEIRKDMPFKYTMYLSPDGRYGDLYPNGSWDGMVKEIIEKRADLALGAFSLMIERKSVIDFTIPFYDLVGISILMKRPDIETPLFKFLYVTHAEVWAVAIVAYFMASTVIWGFDKLSPFSYYNNQEKYKDHDEKRLFTFKESMWYCITSMTPQGAGELPKNLSSQALTICWWIFGFSILCGYTGNLAAYLTSARLEAVIYSVLDLGKQYKIQYATIINSTEYRFFERMANIEKMFYEKWKREHVLKNSPLTLGEYPLSDTYSRMMTAMEMVGFPKDLDEAVLRVRGEVPGNPNRFALLGNAADVKYLALMNCEFYQVGEEFSQKPYAIGLPKGSSILEPLNNLILTFLNRRHLERLKDYWWNRSPKRIRCAKYDEEYDSIGVQNIGGVFVVVFIGIGISCGILAYEYIYYNYLETREEAAFDRWLNNFQKKSKRFRIHIDAYNEETFESRKRKKRESAFNNRFLKDIS